jgi:hypothetical protein
MGFLNFFAVYGNEICTTGRTLRLKLIAWHTAQAQAKDADRLHFIIDIIIIIIFFFFFFFFFFSF